MTTYRARCSQCQSMPVRAFMGKTIDEVRAETCAACGRRLTVIGHQEEPPPAVEKPPGIEFVPITERTNAKAKALIESVFGKESP